MRKFLSAAVLVAFAAVAHAGPVADGNWILAGVLPTGESAQMILKVETKDGTQSASVLFTPPRTAVPAPGGAAPPAPPKTEIRNFKVKGNELSFAIVQGPAERTFVATIGSDAKRILGSLGTDAFPQRAVLTATEKEKLERTELMVRSPAAETYLKLNALQAKPQRLQIQARAEMDAEKKADLMKQAREAAKEAETEMPKIFREVLANHKDTPAAYDAAQALIRTAAKSKATAAEVTEWVAVVEKQGAMYGSRFVKPALTTLADTLADVKDYAPIAVRLVEPMAKELTEKDKASVQFKILTILRNALDNAGRTGELKMLDERLTRLDTQLDNEYLATVPPFKPEPYSGRKEAGANKVAVLELFTGAECPPCVAADVAFDALEKSYKSKDLILLQYHMHIPGPDPLTNPDTVARWDYYRAKFPEGIRGTPSTVFNGKPGAGRRGNGSSSVKYSQYKEIIDTHLEAKTDLMVAGSMSRSGDKLTVNVTVNGADPEAELKLRLVVVEETIKYVGSNQLRFHHQVVRSLIGGPGGVAVKDKAFKHSASADVGEVKKGLTRYLDEFHAERPFPYKHRPMDLSHLKVIALVQDDKTLEILQAAELGSAGATATSTIGQR